MRVVDLADKYHLTTAEAIDLCLAAGIPAESAATSLNDQQVAQWQALAEQQRQWREAAHAEVAAREAAAAHGIDPVTGRPLAPDFGPIPPAPWEGDPAFVGPGAAPRMRTPDEPPEGWAGQHEPGTRIAPTAPVALALAVISLIFPFVTGILALALGWLAKSRIRRSNGRLTGAGMATAAQVIAAVGIVIWVGLLGVSVYNEYQVQKNRGVYADLQVDIGTREWSELAPKMCVRVPHADIPVKNWQELDCASPHEAEVIGTHTLANLNGSPYPGEEALRPVVEQMCRDDFLTYVGIPYSQSQLKLAAVFPNAGNWSTENDRHVACVVYEDEFGYINGSVEHARR